MTTEWGGIDDLVNNAGVWDHAPLLDLTLDQWRRVIDVNLLAPIEISNAAVRRMGHGSAIVNVSSVLGQVSAPTRGPYCVSKSALISLTKMQAIEWADRGIRVNAIAPGVIRTGMTARNIDTNAWYRSAMMDTTPMEPPGEPDDVAFAAVYLASREAKFVNGHVLVVDGGWLTTHFHPRPG